MTRNIIYKPISQDLEKMTKPVANSLVRSSLGLEGTVGEFYYISVQDLIPFHNQARKSFDEGEIAALAESIKNYGIRQPLTVLPATDNKYEIISGERRLKAAKTIGLDKVPCIIIQDTNQAEAIALVENIHRKDLHPLELGITYKNLLDKGIFENQTELAQKISISKSHVSEHIKYAYLEPEIQNFIIEHKIISRDKLREVIKANENQDKEKIKEILGIKLNHNKNSSILRISLTQGIIKYQEKGIEQLSNNQRQELKKYLSKLIQKI